MVDALRRAHRIAGSSGRVVDLHPTADLATIEVGGREIGRVESDDSPLRHAAADRAIATSVDRGLFAIEQRESFSFYTYAGSPRELAEHIRTTWRNSSIDAPTLRLAHDALRHDPRAAVRVVERVIATRFRAAQDG